MQLTRRSLLAIPLLAAAGCGKHASRAATTSTAPPDGAALASARAGELTLLAAYDAEITHASSRERAKLEVQRAIHVTHLSALHATQTAANRPADTDRHDLGKALRRSATELRSLALNAQLGRNAALFASIAASHEASEA